MKENNNEKEKKNEEEKNRKIFSENIRKTLEIFNREKQKREEAQER